MRPVSITAPRPKQEWVDVVNPTGVIEPEHVGQFFFDAKNKLFYRADGPTADDWGLVTPAELPGAMVQSFTNFQAPAHHGMSDAELVAATKKPEDPPPHVLDSDRMGQIGVRIHDARCWWAGATRVLMVRVKLEAPRPAVLFVGFASEPAMPTRPPAVIATDGPVTVYDARAVGVVFEDGRHPGPVFGTVPGDKFVIADPRERYATVRIELRGERATSYLDDVELITTPIARISGLGPRVSLFRYGRFA